MSQTDVMVKRIPVNPFYRKMSVYLYYIDGLLIDTGPKINRYSLIPFFKSIKPKQVALTHHHTDHVGMVPWMAFHQQSTIYCHPNMISLITKDINYSWYKKFFKQKQKSLIKAYPKVINTSNFTFQPIETLGHTYDHVCLYEPNEGWLFTGDLYVTPHPKVSLQGESITEYIDAIESLLQLNFTKVFCGHQGAVNHGREMLKEKLNYLKETKFKVKQLHDLGYSDQEIVKELFPGRVNLEIFTFGSFSRINFVRSCYQERV